MRRIGFYILVLFFMAFTLTSCFEEDERLEPYVSHLELIAMPYSIYTHNVYFDLSSSQIIDVHENDSWDIAFQTGPADHRILVNSSDYLALAKFEGISFENYTALSGEEDWIFDASSGNPDSAATGIWVDTTVVPKHYYQNLYILGRDDGISYTPLVKLKFIQVTPQTYTIVYGELESTDPDTAVITKDTTYNFVGFSFRNGNQISYFEPPKMEWDIVFRQYATILYTTDGIATPYVVRGTMINTHNVSVARDTSSNFEMFAPMLHAYDYSEKWDAIGWDWKDVTIDEATNTAVYKVDPQKIYIINDTEGSYFKMHFISYFNNTGERGYPSFEFEKAH